MPFLSGTVLDGSAHQASEMLARSRRQQSSARKCVCNAPAEPRPRPTTTCNPYHPTLSTRGDEIAADLGSQAYTKGAIYRQMQEYSRKAATYESRLEELHKRSVHHDDHLRIIDAWWRQVGLSSMRLGAWLIVG